MVTQIGLYNLTKAARDKNLRVLQARLQRLWNKIEVFERDVERGVRPISDPYLADLWAKYNDLEKTERQLLAWREQPAVLKAIGA